MCVCVCVCVCRVDSQIRKQIIIEIIKDQLQSNLRQDSGSII